jgi:hypothetical protein
VLLIDNQDAEGARHYGMMLRQQFNYKALKQEARGILGKKAMAFTLNPSP